MFLSTNMYCIPDKNLRQSTPSRRKILRNIGLSAAIGGSAITGVGSASPSNKRKGHGQPPEEVPGRPSGKVPDSIENFDPHNKKEVIGVSRAFERADKKGRRRIRNKLDRTQIQALADAHKLTSIVTTTYRIKGGRSNLDKDRSLADMTHREDIEVLSRDSQSIRNDIDKKWGWSE